jgi:TetR/AcrR family tetracycline transcriptional repressor
MPHAIEPRSAARDPAMTQLRPEDGAPGPGRPRLLTESMILSAAESVLRASGVDAITIRRIADEVGAAPMTLYSTFASKRELLEALAAHLLARHTLMPNATLPLDERVRDWMTSLREALTDARLIELFDAGVFYSATLEATGGWHDQLSAEGLNPAEASRRAQFLLWAVLGFCFNEASVRRSRTLRDPDEALAGVAPELQASVARYRQAASLDDFTGLFELVVDGAVVATTMEVARARRVSRAE